MPKYLIHASYTAEGARGLLKSGGTARRRAVEELLAPLGGKLEAFYFTFGDDDAILIIDLPDQVAASAIGLAVSASGSMRTRSTVLINARRGRRGDQETRQVPPARGVNNGRDAAAFGFPQTRATSRQRGISDRINRCYCQGMKKA
jgi:uncharacterized protein with GYD domain